jgi:putative ABC transport system permease protein
MALGARAHDVLVLIVQQGMKPVCLGLACGLVLASFFARTLAAHLYEVAPTDGVTYAVVSSLVALAALAASYLPARRAARLDPISVLKHE